MGTTATAAPVKQARMGHTHRQPASQARTNPIAALQQKRQALVEAFLADPTADFMEPYTRLLDAYFCACFETSSVGPQMDMIRNPYAIIAQGGYGRSEQCVFSDVDLLFLFDKKVPAQAAHLVEESIYPLWDIGLEVGHATRSLNECVQLARKDYEVLTALLDARFICGQSRLYLNLMDQVRAKILQRNSGEIIGWLIDTNTSRHQRVGDSTHLLEPHLKEGQGGLRDYHTMLWIARIQSDLKQRRDLEYYGYLSHDEYRMLEDALDFIWQVRNRLHHLAGRKCDQLYFEAQLTLAEAMGFAPRPGQQAVELFLGKLHRQMDFIKDQHLMFLYEQGYVFKRRRRSPVKESGMVGVTLLRDRLTFEGPEAILEDPLLLMRIFEASAKLQLPLSAEAKRLVREFGHLVDPALASAPAMVKSFDRILAAPAPIFSQLHTMLRTGLLARFIPAFAKVVDRIQYDEYHLYPVDKHSLEVVETLKRFGVENDKTVDPFCHQLFRNLSGRRLLLWAALLHDIGKGEGVQNHALSGAWIAWEVLSAKGFHREEVETVAFLIEHHLLLVKTATRRDINDEETALACAREIKDVRRLEMLYLLTVADCMATGPKAWTHWTATLLRDFFFKILNVLERGELATGQAVAAMENKKKQLIATFDATDGPGQVASLLEAMSPRYLLYTPADAVCEHIGLYRRLHDQPFVWEVARGEDADTRKVTICAKDRPGLFAKIAGVFTLNNLDILASAIFTWRNQVALDIFTVKAPADQLFEQERWARAHAHLQAALAGSLDLAEALKDKLARNRSHRPVTASRPDRVVVDNISSSFFTLVEVYAYDFPGLLYSVTDALARCDLDVRVAKIATYVDQVVDVFYVRDLHGQKADGAEQVERIKAAIEAVLPGPTARKQTGD